MHVCISTIEYTRRMHVRGINILNILWDTRILSYTILYIIYDRYVSLNAEIKHSHLHVLWYRRYKRKKWKKVCIAWFTYYYNMIIRDKILYKYVIMKKSHCIYGFIFGWFPLWFPLPSLVDFAMNEHRQNLMIFFRDFLYRKVQWSISVESIVPVASNSGRLYEGRGRSLNLSRMPVGCLIRERSDYTGMYLSIYPLIL